MKPGTAIFLFVAFCAFSRSALALPICEKTVIENESKYYSYLPLIQTLELDKKFEFCLNKWGQFQTARTLICDGQEISNRYRAFVEKRNQVTAALKRNETPPSTQVVLYKPLRRPE